MSKKDYIKLGDVMASFHNKSQDEKVFWEMVDRLCIALKENNGLFDEIRFREYIKGRLSHENINKENK